MGVVFKFSTVAQYEVLMKWNRGDSFPTLVFGNGHSTKTLDTHSHLRGCSRDNPQGHFDTDKHICTGVLITAKGFFNFPRPKLKLTYFLSLTWAQQGILTDNAKLHNLMLWFYIKSLNNHTCVIASYSQIRHFSGSSDNFPKKFSVLGDFLIFRHFLFILQWQSSLAVTQNFLE